MPIYFLFLISSAVTFDNLPFYHKVVQCTDKFKFGSGEQTAELVAYNYY